MARRDCSKSGSWQKGCSLCSQVNYCIEKNLHQKLRMRLFDNNYYVMMNFYIGMTNPQVHSKDWTTTIRPRTVLHFEKHPTTKRNH